jgi:NTE family protein
MKTVSLVLGSGGARGLAHIGVIHWLEENGYTIKSISGCSVGSLIGGI